MRIIRHLKVLKSHKLVVVLGTFDGVHRGHRKVINSAKEYAIDNDCELAVIAFDPHPQQVVAPERGLRLLTQVSEKAERLAHLGVDYLILLRFDQKFRRTSYKEFIDKYLVHALKAKAVFVGYDHSFGKGRSGTVKELKQLGDKFGFKVVVTAPVLSRFQPIKSSLIRKEISHGNFNWAVDLLGHPYLIGGLIRHGFGRGAGLGFPTINLKVPSEKLVPAHGIYAGWVRLDNVKKAAMGEMPLEKSERFAAAIYIGSRPTFPEKVVAIEAHLIGVKQSAELAKQLAAGKKVTLELLRWIRADRQFTDVEELKKAIAKDIDTCRKILRV